MNSTLIPRSGAMSINIPQSRKIALTTLTTLLVAAMSAVAQSAQQSLASKSTEDWRLVVAASLPERPLAHYVDFESVKSTPPVVKYRLRQVLAWGDPTAIKSTVLVRANCQDLTRASVYEDPSDPSKEPSRTEAVAEDHYLMEIQAVCRAFSSRAPQTARESARPSAKSESEPNAKLAPNLPPIRATSFGSGFVVASNLVVSNHHVVFGCKRLAARMNSNSVELELLTSTPRSDLALLRAQQAIGKAAPIRTRALLGEDVLAAGHPLSGLLSDDLIVTNGQVSALSGLLNDPSFLQISAPVQPGSSGGPLLDRTGAVVGVVVSKLNAERIGRTVGDLVQNVNFAIKPEVVRLFLETNRVRYQTATPGARLEGPQLAERARQFTVQVLCEK